MRRWDHLEACIDRVEKFHNLTMFELTPELQSKFDRFRDSYEWALVWHADAGGNAEARNRSAIESAKRDLQLSEIEEEMFLRLLKEEASAPTKVRPTDRPPPIAPPEESDPEELLLAPPSIPRPE